MQFYSLTLIPTIKIYLNSILPYSSSEDIETLELTEFTVNPNAPKTGPQDFELLKLLGKGNIQIPPFFLSIVYSSEYHSHKNET